MSIKLFKKYLDICNQLNILPSWTGLYKFKSAFK